MQDAQQPSYYEIALTNRQVLVFFVVLLLCVVGAFFSGVWLGQQRADHMPMIAQVETPAVPEVLSQESETLDELNFFTDEQPVASSSKGNGKKPAVKSEPRPAKVDPAGSPETTLLEDVTGSEAPAPKTRQEARKPARAQASETTVAPPPVSAGGFVIQVFSSPDGTQARKLLNRLTSGGYEAFLSPVEVKGRTMHRVRIGPFPAKGEAETTAVAVEQAFQVDTWVTRNE